MLDAIFSRLRPVLRPGRRAVSAALVVLAGAASLCAVAAPAAAQGKRILHIDSYHKGNEWNDRIAAALVEVLTAAGDEVRVVHLDAKRHPAEEEKQASARRIRDLIEETRPDLVTLSDDDAAKYVLQPYFKGGALPFVFCGLNWDASVYGLPYPNTTGMVEVSPIPQIVSLLRRYARGARIGFLSEDTDTKRKEILHHKRLFGVNYDKTYFARTFAEWKQAYEQAQSEVDMLLVLGVGAIADFDTPAAADFAERVSRIPTGTDFEWLMPVSAFGIAKSPEEQGRWAAQAALKILAGTPPARIPVTYNREGELIFNARIGRRLGIASPPHLAKVVP